MTSIAAATSSSSIPVNVYLFSSAVKFLRESILTQSALRSSSVKGTNVRTLYNALFHIDTVEMIMPSFDHASVMWRKNAYEILVNIWYSLVKINVYFAVIL